MSLPQGVEPSGPTLPSDAPVTDPAPNPVADPVVEEPAPVDDPNTAVNEAASDADLRAWAKDNSIEDVPTSGRLSSAWREQILAAMAAAEEPEPAAEEVAEPALEPEPEVEYRSVWKAPETWVSSQAFTS